MVHSYDAEDGAAPLYFTEKAKLSRFFSGMRPEVLTPHTGMRRALAGGHASVRARPRGRVLTCCSAWLVARCAGRSVHILHGA